MTDETENRLSDEELDNYLTGRHGVSDVYSALEKETSPASLDDRILAHARESIAETRAGSPAQHSRTGKDWHYRPYAIAASLFLCLSVAFMFVDRAPDTRPGTFAGSPADFSAESVAESPDESAPQPVRAPAVSTDSALEEISVRPGAARVQAEQVIVADREQAKTESGVSGNAASAAGISTATQGGNRARSLEELLELVEEARLQERREPPQAISGGLANPVVPPAYRNNPEDWLVEIQRLLDSGEPEQAQAESELLLDRYPDIDPAQALLEAQPQ